MKRLFITLTYIVLAIANALAADNFDFSAVCSSGQTLYYTIVAPNTVEITYPNKNASSWEYKYSGYSKPDGHLTIPDTIINNAVKYTVKSIGMDAFQSCTDIISVKIPNTVTDIDYEAFATCENLKLISIPKTVNFINYQAFNNNDITIYCELASQPQNWFTSYNSYGTLYTDWHSKKGTVIWGIKASITDDFVFYATDTISRQCGVYKYVGNDTDVEIPSKAYFDGNEYAVTSVGYEVFDDYTDLLSVTIPESVRSIDESAFRGCTGLTSITLPDSLVSIGYSAFYGCTGLTTIDIPNSVTTFGDYAFAECTGLTSVTLPDSITEISRCMFENCEGLTSMIIPNTVTKIKEEAFSGCSNLKLVIIPKSVVAIERIAFNSNKITFYCEHEPTPDYWVSNWNSNRGTIFWNVEHKGDYIFRVTNESSHQAEILKYIGADSVLSIPASVTFSSTAHTVTTISETAFKGCENLKSVTIPDVVENIGDSAFYGCSRLPQIVIPNLVTAMGQGVFGDCCSLTIYCIATSKPKQWQADWNPDDYPVVWGTKIDGDFIYQITNAARREISIVKYAGKDSVLVIPSKPIINSLECSITRIGDYAFAECDSLVRITIPNSVQNIGDYAFAGCSRLSEVVIGSGIASIGESAFSECGAVSSIKIGNATPPTISESTFEDVDKWITIDVPCTNIDEYKDSDYWSDFVNYYEPPVYAVTVKAENSKCGNVTITRQPTCDNNQAVFAATSNTGFAFDHWSDGNTENPHTVAVTKDTSFIAFYSAAEVSVSITTANAVQGSVTELSRIHYYSDEITVSATANYGYHFTGWSDNVTTNPRTITLIKDTTIQAQFAINQYEISVNCNETERGTVSGGGSFNYLTDNTILATANYGYEFVHWSDNNTDNPRTIHLSRDTAFTAVFAPKVYELSVTSANEDLGTVAGSNSFDYKTVATIYATAIAAHHHFVQWNDGNRQNPRTVQVLSDTVLVAMFAIDSFNIAATSNNEELGIVTGGGLIAYGTAVEVMALPQPHCHFVEWSNGANGTAQTFNVEKDTAIAAVFAIDSHRLQVASADSTKGTVSGSGNYDYGLQITVSATATAGCYFTGWSDGTTANPRIITIESDTTVVANFEQLMEFNITVVPSDTARGTVSGTGRYLSGTESTLSATPRQHYLFSQWSDGRTDNPRTVRAIADATYTAVFVPMQYNIILSQNNADMGMVSGSGVYSYGERVSCLAKPYPNYHFVQWSNGETANPYEFVVEGNQLLTAYFAAGAVTGIEDDAAVAPVIYAVGKTIIVENATEEILVYDAMGKLLCRDVACRVRTEITVNGTGVYIVKTGSVVMRVVVE
ncbi:MAG: leucine-rich repeat protein [Salinivirgaceae bacterium]|nr:leucine-rich repeat protein [Salinivirgaceae bacterium]